MSIRTRDPRLRILVSSTLQELAEERQAVREAIESLRLVPVMFELGARPIAPSSSISGSPRAESRDVDLDATRPRWRAVIRAA